MSALLERYLVEKSKKELLRSEYDQKAALKRIFEHEGTLKLGDSVISSHYLDICYFNRIQNHFEELGFICEKFTNSDCETFVLIYSGTRPYVRR